MFSVVKRNKCMKLHYFPLSRSSRASLFKPRFHHVIKTIATSKINKTPLFLSTLSVTAMHTLTRQRKIYHKIAHFTHTRTHCTDMHINNPARPAAFSVIFVRRLGKIIRRSGACMLEGLDQWLIACKLVLCKMWVNRFREIILSLWTSIHSFPAKAGNIKWISMGCVWKAQSNKNIHFIHNRIVTNGRWLGFRMFIWDAA